MQGERHAKRGMRREWTCACSQKFELHTLCSKAVSRWKPKRMIRRCNGHDLRLGTRRQREKNQFVEHISWDDVCGQDDLRNYIMACIVVEGAWRSSFPSDDNLQNSLAIARSANQERPLGFGLAPNHPLKARYNLNCSIIVAVRRIRTIVCH
jgi:hypothetical protein